MILRLLLFFSAFSLISGEVTLDQLKWQPNLITKESILEDYDKITPDEPPLFTNITKLVFITEYAPRPYYYARKNAKRFNYVSNVWFQVTPQFDIYGTLSNVDIRTNTGKFNSKFIQEMKELNPDVKMVPKFQFKLFDLNVVRTLVEKETLVQKCAQTIANFCHGAGFDGAVIEFSIPPEMALEFAAPYVDKNRFVMQFHRDNHEVIEQIGNVIRRNNLVAIFTMQPPMNPVSTEIETEDYPIQTQFGEKVMNGYDFVHLWTYADTTQAAPHEVSRQYINDIFLEEVMKAFNYSSKLLVGINFFGQQFPLDAYRKGEGVKEMYNKIDWQRFLQVLRSDDAVFTFNEVTKEHELTSESFNAFIIYPSLTQLEYRIAHVKQYPGVGIAISEYAMGLDYFTNLV